MLSEDFKRFKSISDVQISPDGSRILFVIKTVDEKEDDYSSHIWEVSSGGGKPKQFTYGDGRDSCPRWAPDGKNIMFLSSRGREKGVLPWVISAQGGEARPICSEPKGIENPVWSPDSTQLVITSPGDQPNSERAILVDLVQNYAVQIAENLRPVGWMVAADD